MAAPEPSAGGPPAPVQTSSIVELTKSLVRIPSRAGIDPPEPILDALGAWLSRHGVAWRLLRNGSDETVALVAEIGFGEPGSDLVLNACIDTAGFGDPRSWTHDPVGGEISGGWLYGRGAADSKVAIAICAHLVADLSADAPALRGRLILLADSDEHTGRFGGVKAFTETHPSITGVMIGYPGNRAVVAGARGFYRVRLTVFGSAAHTGASDAEPENALVKAARVVGEISELVLPDGRPGFEQGAKITVTELRGGEGFSVVPDLCTLGVDVRLTPSFGADEARKVLASVAASVDEAFPSRRDTSVEEIETWPAYRLPSTSPLVIALQAAAKRELGREVPAVVCGPSNIGNYLATRGIPATCGFGVTYRNLHAADEAIELATIPMVYRVYERAVRMLLAV